MLCQIRDVREPYISFRFLVELSFKSIKPLEHPRTGLVTGTETVQARTGHSGGKDDDDDDKKSHSMFVLRF